jgi:molybdopterin/thiamine biosynthesis adenylyltransferase/rhodanese-related sulfurtransferase
VSLSRTENARYARHLTLAEIGIAGQEKLKQARVLVVGTGGLGSPAALYLAASGIGTLGLVDCDRVDLSNLQRQILFDTPSVGRPKAEAAAERLRALNPDIQVVAHPVELRAANVRDVIGAYDVILDGTDRLATRYLVNDACVILRKPLVCAAIHRFEGQAMTFVPGKGPCYRCLFPDATTGPVPNCAEAGVLGVLPGVLGTLQATEAIKLVTGAGEPLIGRLLTYDALDLRFDVFRFERRRDCEVCGDKPSITELRDPPGFCSEDAMRAVRRLAPAELHSLLARTSGDDARLMIVDVREPKEFAVRTLPGAVNIPIGDLQRRLREIPADTTPVFLCRSGTRSLRACAVAINAGFASPAHLEGGLLAWAAGTDPAFEVANI